MQLIRQLPQNRIAWLGLLAAIVALVCSPGGRAQLPTEDPVDALRQALKVPIIDPARNPQELAARRDALTRRAAAIKGVGDLRRALLIHEWLDEDQDAQIAEVDRTVRNSIVKRLIDALRQQLQSDNAIAKLAAATMIGEMGITVRGASTPEGSDRGGLARVFAPDLARLAVNDVTPVRIGAATALSKINPEPKIAAPALGKVLQADDVVLRRSAGNGLARLIQEVTQLIPARGKSVAGVVATPEDVVQMGAAVVPEAAKGLHDQDGDVRKGCVNAVLAAATALGDLLPAGREAEVLADERANVRPLAQALAGQGANLGKALADPDPAVRLAACRGLEDLANARLRIARRQNPAILPQPAREPGDRNRGALDNDGSVFLTALEAQQRAAAEDPLLRALKNTLPAVSERLRDPDIRVRLAALDYLEILGEEATPAAPAVIQALSDSNLFVRWAAARTLGRMGPVDLDESVPALAGLLKDPDTDVRLTSALVLERYGPKAAAAVPALARATNTGDVEVRVAALRALQPMREAARPAVPSIAAGLSHPDVRVRRTAAEVLGRIGPAAAGAEHALRSALGDDDAEVRRAASDALLNIISESEATHPEKLTPPKPVDKDGK
jgi:HEAT repeat protein